MYINIGRRLYIPPLEMHVRLIDAPSLYGPKIKCGIRTPRSLSITTFSGGTVLKKTHNLLFNKKNQKSFPKLTDYAQLDFDVSCRTFNKINSASIEPVVLSLHIR